MEAENKTKQMNILDGWEPYGPFKRVLDGVMVSLTDDDKKKLISWYKQFRNPQPSTPLAPIELESYSPGLWGMRMSMYDAEVMGNLDMVGVEALFSLSHRMRLLLDLQAHGLTYVMTHLGYQLQPTLRVMESITDLLSSFGMSFNTDKKREYWVMFSDLPQRRMTIGDLGLPIEWMTDTANFSRYVRKLQVSLQGGEKMRVISEKWTPASFYLPRLVSINGKLPIPTETLARASALVMELRLWEDGHRRKLPPSLYLVEDLGLSYDELLWAEMHAKELSSQRYLTKMAPAIEGLLTREVAILAKRRTRQ